MLDSVIFEQILEELLFATRKQALLLRQLLDPHFFPIRCVHLLSLQFLNRFCGRVYQLIIMRFDHGLGMIWI